MKSVCAWCKADIGEIKEDSETVGITHGICDKCIKILLSENRLASARANTDKRYRQPDSILNSLDVFLRLLR